MPRNRPRRNAWIATKSGQAKGTPVRRKTSTARAGKETFATRTSFGYREAKKSFGPIHASAKPVK
jgi:hypothetical protein